MSITIKAPMVGKLISVDVKEGAKVKKDEGVATIEAMKMQIKVFAPEDGEVKEVISKPGDIVNQDTPIIVID